MILVAPFVRKKLHHASNNLPLSSCIPESVTEVSNMEYNANADSLTQSIDSTTIHDVNCNDSLLLTRQSDIREKGIYINDTFKTCFF